jgi:hypothetical protein
MPRDLRLPEKNKKHTTAMFIAIKGPRATRILVRTMEKEKEKEAVAAAVAAAVVAAVVAAAASISVAKVIPTTTKPTTPKPRK